MEGEGENNVKSLVSIASRNDPRRQVGARFHPLASAVTNSAVWAHLYGSAASSELI